MTIRILNKYNNQFQKHILNFSQYNRLLDKEILLIQVEYLEINKEKIQISKVKMN
jgi:hypothetical protein